jgi:hypothetical protein
MMITYFTACWCPDVSVAAISCSIVIYRS